MKENYSPDEHRWENSQQSTCNSDTGTHQNDRSYDQVGFIPEIYTWFNVYKLISPIHNIMDSMKEITRLSQ